MFILVKEGGGICETKTNKNFRHLSSLNMLSQALL